ncbi:MAG: hypothetical protein JHC59_00740 [Ilumatobacteraceae bacterium]|nr:hypothetical protein [Ilumatobacteraceae bacterium]
MRNRPYFLGIPIAVVFLSACATFTAKSPTNTSTTATLVSQITSHCTDLDAPELGEGKMCIDNGFRIKADDFSFSNWGRSTAADANVTIQTLVDLFGHSAVCIDGPSTECVMRPTTVQKLEEWNNALAGGRCEGLATLSTRFLLKLDDLTTFVSTATRVADLQRGNQLLDSTIVYWWATQFLTEVSDRAATSRSKSPLQLVDDLIQGLANGVGYTVGLYFGSSGHSVTPFAVTHRENDFIIHVYDNNFPGVRKEIVVNGTTNSWTYAAARAQLDGGNIDWNGTIGTLELTPMSSRKGPFKCAFCATSTTATDTVLTIASRDPAAAGYTFITTRDGKRIEATPDSVTNTISGSTYDISKGLGGSLVTIHIPNTVTDFDIEVRRGSSVIPAADVVVAIQRPQMAHIQVSGDLAHTVVGSSSKNSTLIAVRSDSTSVSAPTENSARLSIAAGGQLSRTELPRGHTLLIRQIKDNAIEVAIKGENGSEISSTSLTASENSPATEVTLAINELGTIVATSADVEPVPVHVPSIVNFTPGKKRPTQSTTTTNPTSIEIALPD